MDLTVSHFVVAVLYFTKTNKFKADRQAIQEFFYNQLAKYPEYQALFMFRQKDMFAESQYLDQALANAVSGSLLLLCISSRYYEKTKALKMACHTFSKKKLNSKDFEIINILAHNFDKELGINEE